MAKAVGEVMTINQQEYREVYLKSDHWKDIRQKRIDIDKGECQMCGKTDSLVVHHISYDRLGNEDVDYDLITLCTDCHSWIHNIKNEKLDEVRQMAKEYRQEASEKLRDVACKYRTLGGKHLARIAFEFVGDRPSKKVPTILRLIRETLTYDAGYCSVFPSCGNVSTYTIAAKELKRLRKGKQ